MQLDLSIVIPVYNEEEAIGECLEAIVSTMRQTDLRYELVVVDDGSTDMSSSLVEEAAAGVDRIRIVRHEANLGYNEALRTGYRAVRAKYATHLDADLQNDPADILRFWRCARNLHVPFLVCRSDKTTYTFYRRVISVCYNALSHMLFSTGFGIDVNGIKLIETRVLRRIRLPDRSEIVGVDLIRGARGQGCRAYPLPVRVRPRLKGKSHFRFGMIFSTLANMLSRAMQERKYRPERAHEPAICLSFDLEEWRLPEECGIEHPSNATTAFSREGLGRILRLLQRKNAPSTFFVTGYYAEREAESVGSIQEQGHEIGCHGHEHVDFGRLTQEQIREQIRRATATLTRMCGKAPRGFRAPQFSGGDAVRDHLMEQGYLYDASVHPALVPGRYVDFQTPLSPFIVEQRQRWLAVFPASVVPFARFPISWWWMRNIGPWLTMLGTRMNLKRGRDVILYFHPWEFAELPRIPGIPGSMTRRSGLRFVDGLEAFIDYFQHQGYEFTTMESLLK